MDVRVTGAMLAAAARQAREVSSDITSELAQLVSTIETQGRASFQGSGGTALQNVTVELDGEVRTLGGALTSMADAVDTSNRGLAAADVQAADDLSRVTATHGNLGADMYRALDT